MGDKFTREFRRTWRRNKFPLLLALVLLRARLLQERLLLHNRLQYPSKRQLLLLHSLLLQLRLRIYSRLALDSISFLRHVVLNAGYFSSLNSNSKAEAVASAPAREGSVQDSKACKATRKSTISVKW